MHDELANYKASGYSLFVLAMAVFPTIILILLAKPKYMSGSVPKKKFKPDQTKPFTHLMEKYGVHLASILRRLCV